MINFFVLSLNADASKNGVANEAVKNIRRASKIMAEPEARQVLGVTERASWEEILQVCSICLSLFIYSLLFSLHVNVIVEFSEKC